MEPRPEEGRSSLDQRMEESLARLLRKPWPAKCRNAQAPSHVAFFIQLSYLVDCKVANWKAWGECSVSCGGGSKTRIRKVIQEEKLGGEMRPYLEETEKCKTAKCKGTLSFRCFQTATCLNLDVSLWICLKIIFFKIKKIEIEIRPQSQMPQKLLLV